LGSSGSGETSFNAESLDRALRWWNDLARELSASSPPADNAPCGWRGAGRGLEPRWFAPFSTLAAVQAAAHALSPSPIQRGPVRGPLEDRAIAGEDGAANRAPRPMGPDASRACLAAESAPVLIDDLDRQLLTALARSPRRQLQLVGVIGCYSLTEAAAWLADRARSGETGHSARGRS
jgi:hypothetical protein